MATRKIKITDRGSYWEYPSVPLVAGDIQAYRLVLPIARYGAADTVKVSALRADGVTVTGSGRVINDSAEYTLHNNMYSIPGDVRIRMTLISADGSVLTAAEMTFCVLEASDDSDVAADDRYPVLSQALVDVSDALRKTETAADNANNAAEQANIAATNANTAAIAASTAATTANSAANKANAAATNANGAADKANDAAEKADIAAESANTVVNNMNTTWKSIIDSKAPINHSSTDTTYGIGDGTHYGHVKLSDSISSALDASDGTAATPKALLEVHDIADETARGLETEATARENADNQLQEQIGLLSDLETTNKTNLVEAINETACFIVKTPCNTDLDTLMEDNLYSVFYDNPENISGLYESLHYPPGEDIGLLFVGNPAGGIVQFFIPRHGNVIYSRFLVSPMREFSSWGKLCDDSLYHKIGTIESLQTNEKSNLVSAINEIAGGFISDKKQMLVSRWDNEYCYNTDLNGVLDEGMHGVSCSPADKSSELNYPNGETAGTLIVAHGESIDPYYNQIFIPYGNTKRPCNRLYIRSFESPSRAQGYDYISDCDWVKIEPDELATDIETLRNTISHKKCSATFVIGTTASGHTENDCDYLCDSTADDVEINAAIQALPSTGGKVLILEGTYQITNPVAVNKSYVQLSGCGDSTILKRVNKFSHGVIYTTANNSITDHLFIDGNWENGLYGEGYHGIEIYKCSNAVVTKVRCNNNGGKGIYVDAGSNSGHILTDNICYNNGYEHIYISGSKCYVSGNICSGSVMLHGIQLYYCENSNVVGNICTNNKGRGLLCQHAANNTIVGNTCDDNDSGLALYTDSNNNTVCGNVSSNNKNYGIYVGTNDNAITGNTCNDNNIGGLNVYNGNRNNISGNTVHNNAIYIRGNSNTIIGNSCMRGEGTAADYTDSQYTIYIVSGDHNHIADNLIMGKNYVNGGGTGNTFVNNKYE